MSFDTVPSDWLIPDWPAPANVRAVMTTRQGGVSLPPFDSFNTATHVEDAPEAVIANRALLRQCLPAEPRWLNQIHGQVVARFGDENVPPHAIPDAIPDADASVAFQPAQVCVVQTADCLPALFCDEVGSVVAAAHAGWRGLAGGVLEETVHAMSVDPASILVWLGAAIGPKAFEVGAEVVGVFENQNPATAAAFHRHPEKGTPHADIYALARIRLAAVGVNRVYGGGLCTFSDPARFFSFRREKRTGRMASLIWLQPQ